MQITWLHVEREETIHAQFGRANAGAERREQFRRFPITNFKIPFQAESAAGLVLQASHSEHVGHLHQNATIHG